jgi:hypothetical protein
MYQISQIHPFHHSPLCPPLPIPGIVSAGIIFAFTYMCFFAFFFFSTRGLNSGPQSLVPFKFRNNCSSTKNSKFPTVEEGGTLWLSEQDHQLCGDSFCGDSFFPRGMSLLSQLIYGQKQPSLWWCKPVSPAPRR